MSRPISFYRWYRGKVWHVGFTDDALAACGKERPADAETVGERAPVNARVCGDCVATSLHLYALAQAGQIGDPRTPERGLISVPGAPLPEVGDGPQAVDLVGALRASVEAARERRAAPEVEEWLCECGHSNLDHDVDGMQWCRATGECLCPGLTRVGGPTSMDAAADVIWRWSGIVPNGSLPDSMIYRAARANAHPDRQGGDRGPWDAVETAGKLLGLAG